ncbi:MAG: transglycosylase SLT domain-containing protein, partial [Alphaproteobacteria bacterium]|nr:transglycosylase SLT domain-containing protein [Alphaproteobacteria bacterium]
MDIALLAGYGLRLLGVGLILCFGVLALVPTVDAATQAEVTQIIADEAAKNGHVPLSMALAVAKVESDMREDAVSTAGARGVMQIMPATAMG